MSDTERKLPRDIKARPKAYAFERSLGIPPAEACRRAGGKVDNGDATRWENTPRVRAWISYYRSIGQDEEMIAAKRARIEQRLEMAAYGNIFDFAAISDETGNQPVIDWNKVANSPYGVIIAGFKFDKDTGRLVDFERDNALAAAAQLRDMHGFKAPAKAELTGKNGTPLFDLSKLSDEQLAALESIASAAGGAASA
jgi:hypothetical protein